MSFRRLAVWSAAKPHGLCLSAAAASQPWTRYISHLQDSKGSEE